MTLRACPSLCGATCWPVLLGYTVATLAVAAFVLARRVAKGSTLGARHGRGQRLADRSEMTETATTVAGKVRGEAIPAGVAFRGIPFAEPPIGTRRFLPPDTCIAWDGVRDCTAFGPICPQVQHAEEAGGIFTALGIEPTDEDCLFLNVWTPAVDHGLRPTMVWVHGGSLTSGSGSSWLYDGASFARDGVVMVSLNYRLHAFGFLYLHELFDEAEGTGNLGILDQIAALEWVRGNIAEFGGDPDNVTIFGESAGGMSVGTLMGTPAASGLFRRAIAQSGAAQHNISPSAAGRVTQRVLELLEVTPGDWDALRAAPSSGSSNCPSRSGRSRRPACCAVKRPERWASSRSSTGSPVQPGPSTSSAQAARPAST